MISPFAADETTLHQVLAPDVGRVLAQTDNLSASYCLTGDELYVRARITANKPHPLPHGPGDTKMAWTQSVTPQG